MIILYLPTYQVKSWSNCYDQIKVGLAGGHTGVANVGSFSTSLQVPFLFCVNFERIHCKLQKPLSKTLPPRVPRTTYHDTIRHSLLLLFVHGMAWHVSLGTNLLHFRAWTTLTAMVLKPLLSRALASLTFLDQSTTRLFLLMHFAVVLCGLCGALAWHSFAVHL